MDFCKSAGSGSQPLVSVLVSAFQQPTFLNEALQSVQAQTWKNLEIIVVDDASGPEFTCQYQLSAGTKLLVHPHRRATAAINRNTAIGAARGKYLAFLDQDDLWVPEKLSWQVAIMEERPAAVLTFGHYRLVDAGGVPLETQHAPWVAGRDPFKQLIYRNIIHCPSQVMMRRSALDQTGGFDETIRGAADWDMWIRAAAAGPILSDTRVVALYRKHAGQWSRQSLMMVNGAVRVMEKTACWAPSVRPDLRGLLRRRTARWLRETARIQLTTAEQSSLAYSTLLSAIRLWPGDPRAYCMLLRARRAGKG